MFRGVTELLFHWNGPRFGTGEAWYGRVVWRSGGWLVFVSLPAYEAKILSMAACSSRSRSSASSSASSSS